MENALAPPKREFTPIRMTPNKIKERTKKHAENIIFPVLVLIVKDPLAFSRQTKIGHPFLTTTKEKSQIISTKNDPRREGVS